MTEIHVWHEDPERPGVLRPAAPVRLTAGDSFTLRTHVIDGVVMPWGESVTHSKWDTRGLGLAREVATWSSCTRDKVGAVVMSPDHDVISTGFNDTARGEVNCGDGGCPRAQRNPTPGQGYLDDECCLHAEQNALQRAGLAARGATLYVTREPCGNCTRAAKTAGIARTVTTTPG